MENHIRGTLRALGLMVGRISRSDFEERVRELIEGCEHDILVYLETLLKVRKNLHEGYDLLTADEISRIFNRADPAKRQLILLAGLKPMILQRVEYYDDKSPFWHLFRDKID